MMTLFTLLVSIGTFCLGGYIMYKICLTKITPKYKPGQCIAFQTALDEHSFQCRKETGVIVEVQVRLCECGGYVCQSGELETSSSQEVMYLVDTSHVKYIEGVHRNHSPRRMQYVKDEYGVNYVWVNEKNVGTVIDDGDNS